MDDQVVGAFASDLFYNLNKAPSSGMDDIPFISLLQNVNKPNVQSCSPSGVSHSSAMDEPVSSPDNEPPLTDHLLHQYASDAASDDDENCNQDGFVLIDSVRKFFVFNIKCVYKRTKDNIENQTDMFLELCSL